jgi:hypothetical protein
MPAHELEISTAGAPRNSCESGKFTTEISDDGLAHSGRRGTWGRRITTTITAQEQCLAIFIVGPIKGAEIAVFINR